MKLFDRYRKNEKKNENVSTQNTEQNHQNNRFSQNYNQNKRNNNYKNNYNNENKNFRTKNSSEKNFSKDNNFQNKNKNNQNFNKNRNPHNNRRNHQRNFSNNNQNNKPIQNTKPNEAYVTSSSLNWQDNASYRFNQETEISKLKIIPMSGVEEVGINCTVLEYENDIVVVDLGLGFPDEFLPGVDALVPNLSYLDDKKDKIRGVIITHGHTDHIGALHLVIERLGFPMIYAPRLAAELIREKLKETSVKDLVKITEVDVDSEYYLGKFQISHFKMTHTIPDNYGIVFNTPVGRVVTTSDYKFDSSPYRESPSDYSRLAKLGDEGVLLSLDESTNAMKQGWSESETNIARDIDYIIRTASGRVIIGMFSTMVNRIRQVIEMAARYDKKVAVLGRSLENMVKITHSLGYIDVVNSVFIPYEEINTHSIPDNKVVVLTTGSQGEPNAALMRMALGEHPKLTLKREDTIVFSSSKIPGNEGKIDRLINLITNQGAKVLTNDYLDLHASGHGHKEDHKLMIRLLKPKFMMPIHGMPSMLRAHMDTAIELGYKENDIIMTKNGSIVELSKDSWNISGQIESNPLWVEGNRIGNFDERLVEERKVLSDEGVVIVSIKDVEKDISEENIYISHRGFFIQSHDNYLTTSLPRQIVNDVNAMKDRQKDLVSAHIRKIVENELIARYEKRPLIVVNVI